MTATTITLAGERLTLDREIRGQEVTLVGVTGSANVHGHTVRLRGCNLDELKVMAARLIVDGSNIDTVTVENPDWFWGRIDQVDINLGLSHIYGLRAEHIGNLHIDRTWLSLVEAETMGNFQAYHSHIDELWAKWNTPPAHVEGCAIGRSNLLVADAATANGHRLNLMAHPEDGTITVTFRGRSMNLGTAKQVFEDNTELMALLRQGIATITRKKEVYA
jgi:hypothetical protein